VSPGPSRWGDGLALAQDRGNHALKLLGLSTSTGAVTSFRPTIIGGVLGVRALAVGSNRLLAVGDFSSVGSTNKLHAVAIFP